jgi:hypothetical protein
LWKRFARAVYFYHGQSWRSTRKSLEEALENLLDHGYLSDADKQAQNSNKDIPLKFLPEGSIREELTTTIDEKKVITEKDFFDEFDKGPIYFKDKVNTDYLKRCVKKITGSDSKYAWREQWGKRLRETGRVENISGTNLWKVNRCNFLNIPDDLKELYEKRIQIKGLTSFKMSEDKVAVIYRKLDVGEIVSLDQVCKIAKLKNNNEGELEAKEIIDKLVIEGKLDFVRGGRWEVVDPTGISNTRLNNLFIESNKL